MFIKQKFALLKNVGLLANENVKVGTNLKYQNIEGSL